MTDKVDIDPNEIVKLLNTMLALEPKVILSLMENRPEMENDELKEFMRMKGNKVSFLGIINTLLLMNGSKYMVGADCEFDDGKMVYVKFFHLLERK